MSLKKIVNFTITVNGQWTILNGFENKYWGYSEYIFFIWIKLQLFIDCSKMKYKILAYN